MIWPNSIPNLRPNPCTILSFRESTANTFLLSAKQVSYCHHPDDHMLSSRGAGLCQAVVTWLTQEFCMTNRGLRKLGEEGKPWGCQGTLCPWLGTCTPLQTAHTGDSGSGGSDYGWSMNCYLPRLSLWSKGIFSFQ